MKEDFNNCNTSFFAITTFKTTINKQLSPAKVPLSRVSEKDFTNKILPFFAIITFQKTRQAYFKGSLSVLDKGIGIICLEGIPYKDTKTLQIEATCLEGILYKYAKTLQNQIT